MKLYELFEFYKNKSNKYVEFSVWDNNFNEFVVSNSKKDFYYIELEEVESKGTLCLTEVFNSNQMIKYDVERLPLGYSSLIRDRDFTPKQARMFLEWLLDSECSKVLEVKYNGNLDKFYNDCVFISTKEKLLRSYTEIEIFNNKNIFQIDNNLYAFIICYWL